MERLRLIPSIDTLQKDEVFEAILQEETVSKALLTKWLKAIVDNSKTNIKRRISVPRKKRTRFRAYHHESIAKTV